MLPDSKILLVSLHLLLPNMCLLAQIGNVIMLNNPSFEGFPRQGKAPSGWFNCGFVDESPPDVQPGSFEVENPASAGHTYLGMVVRDNETWEAVGQRLNGTLMRNHCYEMTADFCQAYNYISVTRATGREAKYDGPVMVYFWGGTTYCDRREKLAEIGPIHHTDWRKYTVKMCPAYSDYSHLMIEVHYKPNTPFAYNGNLLTDNLSYIREVPAPIQQKPKNDRISSRTPPNKRVPNKPKTTDDKAVTKEATVPVPAVVAPLAPAVVPPAPKVFVRTKLIETKVLYFAVNQYDIPTEYEAYLSKLAEDMKNSRKIIEAGGHTNNNASDKFAVELSERRAKSVANRLIDLGIPAERVTYKGYGKSRPQDSNLVEKGREQNQRVEIQIWETEN
jgi:outer membrane protein OmpA-like peptidoglycan-associated protein